MRPVRGGHVPSGYACWTWGRGQGAGPSHSHSSVGGQTQDMIGQMLRPDQSPLQREVSGLAPSLIHSGRAEKGGVSRRHSRRVSLR